MSAAANSNDDAHQDAFDTSTCISSNNSITATTAPPSSTSSMLPCFVPEQATTAAELCDQYQQILQEHIRLSHKYLQHNQTSMPLPSPQHHAETTTLSSAMIMMLRRQRRLEEHDDEEDDDDCSVDMSIVSNDIDGEEEYDYDEEDNDVVSLVDSYFDNAEMDSVVVRRRQIQTADAAVVTPTSKPNKKQNDEDSVHFDFEWNDTAMLEDEDDENAFGSIMAAAQSSINTAYSFDLGFVLQDNQRGR